VIVLAGTYRIAPGRRADAEHAIRAIVSASRAEPGCLDYAHAFDATDDHLVRVFEVFEDEAALTAHRESAHMAAWRAEWAPKGLSGRAMKRYDVSAMQVI
jgi:quinol monooxygenase YgiN